MAKKAKGKRASGKKGDQRGKRKIKRMNLNVDTALHDAFKAATAAQGKKMTAGEEEGGESEGAAAVPGS